LVETSWTTGVAGGEEAALGGLQTTKKGKTKRMRAADGKMRTSAEEDAKIFEAHFKAL
jgi:hypothetical protein